MNRKFKHKQTGAIAVQEEGYYTIGICSRIPRNLIENTSDWEEIKEKEWEILAFRSKITSNLFKLDNNGFYVRQGNWEIGDCLKLTANLRDVQKEIYSVKRLSDGEIFTISDKTPNGSIVAMRICGDKLIVYTGSAAPELKNVRKLKQPLFKTEDGVDIYEGDEFCFVKFTESKSNDFIWKVSKWTPAFIYEPHKEKYFSTEKAAQEYIYRSKPCLSFLDVVHGLGLTNSQEAALMRIIKGEKVISVQEESLDDKKLLSVNDLLKMHLFSQYDWQLIRLRQYVSNI